MTLGLPQPLPLIAAALWFVAAPLCAQPSTGLDRLDIRNSVEQEKLTGQGVHIAVFSETIDLEHSAFDAAQIRLLRPDSVKVDPAIVPMDSAPLLAESDWHGTHVAGIIAAACDHALRGVACASRVTVYDFGVYGDFEPLAPDMSVGEIESDFLLRLTRAFEHATKAGVMIANLSFNVEAPALAETLNAEASGTAAQLMGLAVAPVELWFENRDNLRFQGVMGKISRQSWQSIASAGVRHDDPPALIVGYILPQTREWHDMAAAIAAYQARGGVIVISESNNSFDGRSGVLNALPSAFASVLGGAWLSTVQVAPKGAGYATRLNGCGKQAADYCIAVRADDVLSLAPYESTRVETGHSMATPMVSGLIAIMVEKGRKEAPGFSTRSAVCVIRRTARRDFANYAPAIHGLGVLDAEAALASVRRADQLGCLAK